MTTFYLPIEISKRELVSKIFLATKLANMGHQVVVFYYKIFDQTLWPSAGIYIGKNCFRTLVPQSKKYYGAMKRKGIDVWHLDEEAGIFTGETVEDWEKDLFYRLDPTHLDENDKLLTWGQWQADYYKRTDCAAEIVVTGSPNFDLMQPKYSQCLMDYDTHQVGGMHDYILINTRFGITNGQFSLEDYLAISDDELKQKWLSWSTFDGAIKYLFVHMIQSLASVFPDEEFVLRPHPAEKEAFYQLYFSATPNVHIHKKGEVGAWIRQCKALVQNGSSTAIQADINLKPVFTYLPLKEEDSSSAPLANQIGTMVHSVNELAEKLLQLNFASQKSWQRTISHLDSIDAIAALVERDRERLPHSDEQVLKKKLQRYCAIYHKLDLFKQLVLTASPKRKRHGAIYDNKFEKAYFAKGEMLHAAANRYYQASTKIKRYGHYCYLISA
jgi:surface carbohydrate biosynthesis protein